MDVFVAIALTVIGAATPLLFAALGELISERAGLLNLGVEGMMLCGAIAAFAAVIATGNAVLAVLAGLAAGALLAALFAVLVLELRANQVASGLALTLFGIGLSALVGSAYVGTPYAGLPTLAIPVLADLPVVGELLFRHDALVYLSVLAAVGIWLFLNRTRAGLALRAIGESHDAAHALGLRVRGVRYAAALFGGAFAGLGGAYISLAYSPMWAENMVAGRGWIALALVVFATWRPERVLAGAYLFGGVTVLQLHAQGLGVALPSQLLSALPYVATIIVLAVISRDPRSLRANTPASLGKRFDPPG